MDLTDAFKLSIDAQLGAIELLLCLRRHKFLKFYQLHVGKQKPFKGIIEPRSGDYWAPFGEFWIPFEDYKARWGNKKKWSEKASDFQSSSCFLCMFML